GESVFVKPAGLHEFPHRVQAACQYVRCLHGVRVVVAENPTGPGKGVLTDLAGFAVGTGKPEDQNEDMRWPSGMPVIGAEAVAPALMKMPGEVTCQMVVTTVPQVSEGPASKIPQVRAGTRGGICRQEVRQQPCPQRPGRRVALVTRSGRDQQRLRVGAGGARLGSGELAADGRPGPPGHPE